MGVRTRHLDMLSTWRQAAATRATRDEAMGVVERWNTAIAAGYDVWWSPAIRAALVAGMPYADVFCPGCRTSRSIDLRTIDRHPLASIGSLVLGLQCSWYRLLGILSKARRQQQQVDPRPRTVHLSPLDAAVRPSRAR
jgi:hypothetical protein